MKNKATLLSQKLIASCLITTYISSILFLACPINTYAQDEDFSNSVTSRISKNTITPGAESDGASFNPRVSKNGRFVVFESTATNLVPDPVSDIDWDSSNSSIRRIYLYDRQADSLELVSITSPYSATPFTDIKTDSFNPVVSNDGRYVAFTVAFDAVNAPVENIVDVCDSSNCQVNIAHEGQHIYVRDRLANDTMLISQITAKVRRQIVTNGVPQVTDDTTCIKRPSMETLTKRIAARIIADCTLTPPYDNSVDPILTTPRCSDGAFDGRFEVAKSDNARISSDGRYIVYDTDANNLSLISEISASSDPISGTRDWDFCCGGGCAGEEGYVNSLRSGGSKINYSFESISGYDDREFYKDDLSTEQKIRDIYVRDGSAFTTKMISQFCQYHETGTQCDIDAVQDAIKPSISDDGSLISFQTKTPFLSLDLGTSLNDDIFVIERSQINGEIENLTRISNNTSRIFPSNGNSTDALLSADGRYVVFQSTGSNLVSIDTNSVADVFIFDRTFNRTLLCSKLADGTQLNAASTMPSVSGSGQYLSFESAATNTQYTGTFGNISQAYIAKVSKNSDGSLKDCAVSLASSADNQGANQSVIGTGVAVVPQTSSAGDRIQRSSIVYESTATNLDASSTDANGLSDIFQAPVCSDTDKNTDTDGDLTTDCFDQCYKDSIKVEDADTDSDGFPDCEDGCISDPQKSGPGECGCGVEDIDSDDDGTFDCDDLCPNDPEKTAVGECGCGISDIDENANGTADCNDSTVPTPVATATPIFTPTVTPTATPNFTAVFQNLTPLTPTLKKGKKRGSLILSVNTDNVPNAVNVTGIDAKFSCKEGSKTKTYSKKNSLGGVLKGFRSGSTCTVEVTLRGELSGSDLRSLTSSRSKGARVG